MIVNFEDKEYEFSLDDIDVPQARFIKRKFGMTLMDLENGLGEADPDALVALYWLMQNQNGVTVDPDKVNFKLVRFGIALKDAVVADNEANPTDQPDEATASQT
jgi:hypothetical protein